MFEGEDPPMWVSALIALVVVAVFFGMVLVFAGRI